MAKDIIFRDLMRRQLELEESERPDEISLTERLAQPRFTALRERFLARLRIGSKWASFLERFGLCTLIMVNDDIVRDAWVAKVSKDVWQTWLSLIDEKNKLVPIFRQKGGLFVGLLKGDPIVRTQALRVLEQQDTVHDETLASSVLDRVKVFLGLTSDGEEDEEEDDDDDEIPRESVLGDPPSRDIGEDEEEFELDILSNSE
jgi:hypothetical protein